ncbi:MAG: ATP-binding cassette domain-containing protein, partial [Chloroflexi bacterium]
MVPADGCVGCGRSRTCSLPRAHEETEVTTAIQTKGLTKDYGSGHGIFDLDLAVEEGEVFGYLGPNGAGKTTTIKLLMSLIHATRGSATILGLDADRDAVPLKRKIGYVPGELPQFGGWRGSEIVAYVAGLRGDMTDGDIEA